jgi:hypothetical protein
MKLAVMQPYFLPYVGYFQLIAAVDRFVIYDDVSFIKGGWINRNRLLLNGKPQLFSIPLSNGSSGVAIRDVKVAGNFPKWRSKFFNTLSHAYKKAPNYQEISAMLERWLRPDTKTISEINKLSLIEISNWLGISTEIITSSSVYDNTHLERRERLVDICKREDAHVYINGSGGRFLYDKAWFMKHGIELHFLDSTIHEYPQSTTPFVPNLSVLDLMMNVPSQIASQVIGMGRFS